MATTDYDPFIERNVKHPTTDFETFIHLVKGSLGAGILTMPYAFQHIGLWAGIPGTFIVGFLCAYCIHMLVKASQTLCYRCRVPRLTYAETAKEAFQNDPRELKKWGIAMSCIINLFLMVDLMACVCIYLVNVGRNVQQILDLHVPNNGLTIRHWILILSVPLLFLCLIRDLKFLVPFSMIANILIISGLIITFCFFFVDLPNPNEVSAIKSPTLWPAFFGTSIFALECIGVVLPCENEMKNPRHFTGCPSVFVYAMSVVVSLYTIIGFFGYLKYGEDIEVNLILNLPVENVWCQLVKSMVAVAIYCTILLQYYVPINIILNSIRKTFPENYENLCENSIRIASTVVCTLMAVAFPNMEPFISVIGAICLSVLGLILPSILDIVVFHDDPGFGYLKIHLVKDIFLIVFGIIGLLTGTGVALSEFHSINCVLLNKKEHKKVQLRILCPRNAVH